jgi:hypothetical protein
MRATELALERASIEAFWFSARLTLDQRRANRLDLSEAQALAKYRGSWVSYAI